MLKSKKLKQEMKEKTDMLEKLTAGSGSYNETSIEIAILAQEYAKELVAESEKREGLKTEDTPDNVERMRLYSTYKISNVLLAMKSGKLTGVEAEMGQELKLAQNELPIEVFESDRPKGIKVVTGAPGTVGVNLQPIMPFVFAPSIASMLGISMPEVPSGTYAIPVISAALSASARARDTDQAATAATFRVDSMSPKRVSARLELLIEDIFAAGTNLEPAMRQNLSMVLSAELDNQIINGDGAAPNLSGLFHALDDPDVDGTTLTFDHGLIKLASLVDGLWAAQTSDVAQIVGLGTYRLAASLTSVPATGGKGELTLADYMMQHSGGFRTNSRMPVKVGTKQQSIAHRRGMPGITTAVIPSWGKIQIDDPYSASAKGQKSVTVHAIVGDLKILQPGAYAQVEYKVS